jgi:bacteriorhodopsin
MSTLTHAAAAHDTQSRSRWLWMLLAGLAMGQLFAFWLLCSHQVRKAEARQNESVIHQMALSDCLQYIPGSTIASCTSRMDPNAAQATQPAPNPAATGAVPVSFSYR